MLRKDNQSNLDLIRKLKEYIIFKSKYIHFNTTTRQKENKKAIVICFQKEIYFKISATLLGKVDKSREKSRFRNSLSEQREIQHLNEAVIVAKINFSH